jgi:hypothetical protein
MKDADANFANGREFLEIGDDSRNSRHVISVSVFIRVHPWLKSFFFESFA